MNERRLGWTWNDKTPSSWANWFTHQKEEWLSDPDGGYTCAAMKLADNNESGTWMSMSCTNKEAYVCEIGE